MMEQQRQDDQNKISQQQLQINKKQMLRILKQAPVAGVYLGQNQQKWHQFFQFYMNFLKAQSGPRGECSKKVRLQMSKNPELYDEILKLIKMNHSSHIKDIYVKYKTYYPCEQYNELISIQQYYEKFNENYKNIMDESSIMYNKIKKGMTDKKGQDYDYKKQIQQIRQNYKQKLQTLTSNIETLKTKVQANENYINYMKLKQCMKQFFRMWKEADVRIGQQSIQKGDTFQKIVQNQLKSVLLKRSGIKDSQKYRFQTNCRWYPKALGQIDICIALYNELDSKWEVKVLIQCKSRLFDIRQAYKQVGILKQKGKQKLCTKIGILDIADDPMYFIVTTLPQNPFHLPIQSKLKQALQRASKNKSINQLDSKQMYSSVKQVFKQLLSPLDWFIKNDSDKIIVLKY